MNRSHPPVVIALFALLPALAWAGPAVPVARAVRILPAAQVKDLAQLDEAMGRSFTDPFDVTLAQRTIQKKLLNCRDLLAVASQKPDTGPDDEWYRFSERAAHCQALRMLKQTVPARLSFVDGFKLGPGTVATLPGAFHPVFSQDEGRKLAALVGKTWKQVDKSVQARGVKAGAVQVRTREADVALIEYGRGDVDGDGVEDIVVRRNVQLRQGSAAQYTVLVLTRREAGGPLVVSRTIEPFE